MNGEGWKAAVALLFMLAVVLMGFVVVLVTTPAPTTHTSPPSQNNTTRHPPPPPPPPPHRANFSASLTCMNSTGAARSNGSPDTVVVECHVRDSGVAPFTYVWSATNQTERVNITENGSAWLNLTFHLRPHGCMHRTSGFWLEVTVRTGDSLGSATRLSDRVGVWP